MPLERHALDKGGDHYMNLSYRNLSSIVVIVFVKKRFVFGFAVRFASFRHGGRRGRCIVCLERGLDWWDANRTLVVVVVVVVRVVVVAGVDTIAATARFGFVGSFRFIVLSFDVHVVVVGGGGGNVLGNWIVNFDLHHVAVIDDIDDGFSSYCAEALVIVPSSVDTFPTNLGPNVVRGGHRKFLTAYAFHDYTVVQRPRLVERDATTLSSLFDGDVGALQTKR